MATVLKESHLEKSAEVSYQIRWHPGQRRAWDSTKRFVGMLAGTQGGKTVLVPPWLHREIGREGAGDYLAVTANYDLFKLKLLPELLDYFERRLPIGRYWAQDRIIEIAEDLAPLRFLAKTKDDPMWARIILRSAEAEAGLEAATCKAAALDEADHPDFKRTAWEAVQRRLSISQGRVLFTTSLYHWGWLKTEIYDRWRAGDPDKDIIQFDSMDNPAFPRAEYDRARSVLPRWKFNLFYRGQYEKPAGLIYDSFDEAVCKIPRFPIPKEWPVFVGHDFGGANPAAMFYAIQPTTGLIFAFAEYRPREKRSVYQQVVDFGKITAGYNVIKRIGGSHQEEGWRGDYTTHGWPIQEPKQPVRDVEVGIEHVFGLHSLNKVMVFSDLHDYLDEKMSYSRELDENYQPTDKIEDKERFHLMDAERYILSDFTPETVSTGRKPLTVHSARS